MKRGKALLVVLAVVVLVSLVSAACNLKTASWGSTSVIESENVLMTVEGKGNCGSEQVNFSIYEYDPGPLAPDDYIGSVIGDFLSNWTAGYYDEGGLDLNPEYYFLASLVSGGKSIQSNNPNLGVNKSSGPHSPDVNSDLVLDVNDVTIVIFNQGRSAVGPFEHLDIDGDSDIDWDDVQLVVANI